MANIINYDLLWQEIGRYAKKVGRASARPAYVVLPIDLISAKRLPIIGWLDEVVSLTVAYQKVCKYITKDMERKADELLDKWFPDYTPYLEVK